MKDPFDGEDILVVFATFFLIWLCIFIVGFFVYGIVWGW